MERKEAIKTSPSGPRTNSGDAHTTISATLCADYGDLSTVWRSSGTTDPMKFCHIAALTLVGWFLTLNIGQTYPKDCPECGVGLGLGQAFGGPPFKTKAECEKAGNKEVQVFYEEAKKNGEQVAWPTSFRCIEKRNSQ